jgi:O-methyltransferase
MNLRKFLNTVLVPTGYELSRRANTDPYPSDFTSEDKQICDTVRPCTMARHVDRIYSVINATRYVVHNNIQGAITECGVWRGGMMMAAALTLKQLGHTDRDLYLFDTFAGMVQPGELDRDARGNLAEESFRKAPKTGEVVDWCFASVDEVKKNMASTGYPKEKMFFVQGKVEDTIPANVPDRISVLRLDTDWYESSLHEMVHLFPRLQRGGILILDDYGFWQGSRKATDEYFQKHGIAFHLVRVDSSSRVGVKIS